MRPSLFVRAVKGALGPRGRRRVRVTGREVAGWPVVVSRTWQVIGSFFGAGGEVGVGVALGRGVRVVLV